MDIHLMPMSSSTFQAAVESHRITNPFSRCMLRMKGVGEEVGKPKLIVVLKPNQGHSYASLQAN